MPVGKDYIEFQTVFSNCMSTQVQSLRDLYVDVAGEETLIDRQREVGPREPINASDDPSDEVSDYVRAHGLDDALEGAETEL